MTKPDYTDKLDYSCSSTYTIRRTPSRIDFSGGDMYTGLARKLDLLIDQIVHTAKMEDMYIGKLLIQVMYTQTTCGLCVLSVRI